MGTLTVGKSQELYRRAKHLIPGGTQLLSKRPEMFLPELWPSYYQKASGCEVWDLDGRRYIDMSYMGIGACILGYADPDVDAAVKAVIDQGSMCTLNAPEEVELAEILTQLHPWARMVRYARSGGEAMALAVRLARAHSRRDVVLFCGYHGWHDWYLAANLADERSLDGHLLPGLAPAGVPRGLQGTSHPFTYNDTAGFLNLVDRLQDRIGVVVVETIRNHEPDPEFFATLRRVTRERGMVLVLDEISAGWRLNLGGAHLLYGLEPDLAVFAKAVSNGFPMAAVVGREEVMQAAQETFISSTYWTDRIGPAAALATIRKLRDKQALARLAQTGRAVQAGWRSLAEKRDLAVEVGGIYPLSHFSFSYDEPLVLKTLFTQLMLERGFLATTAFYASYAHEPTHLDAYLEAVDEVFGMLRAYVAEGRPAAHLQGPMCHAGFKRLT